MKVKTSELSGDALDLAVSHCVEWSKKFPIMPLRVLPYSTDWAAAGPIIEREKFDRIIANISDGHTVSKKIVEILDDDSFSVRWMHGVGPTLLIAAMRCYVASKLGDEVEVPDELLQGESNGTT